MDGMFASSSDYTIDFERNYPKLRQSDSLIFTTLRKDNEENYKRFNGKEGKFFEVSIEGQFVWTAKLLLVARINSADLSGSFLAYDTDYEEARMREVIRNRSDHLLLIFRRWLPQEQLEVFQ